MIDGFEIMKTNRYKHCDAIQAQLKKSSQPVAAAPIHMIAKAIKAAFILLSLIVKNWYLSQTLQHANFSATKLSLQQNCSARRSKPKRLKV
jgi:hypothetical protein